MDEGKKVLFVVGMDHQLNQLIKQVPNINPQNMIILESYSPFILQPFGDFMRDIILAVYQENVEEIFVVTTKADHQYSRDILNKMYENKELQKKMKILDYLFENCGSEFPEDNIRGWLAGGNHVTDHVQRNADVIRQHPLLPSFVKVTELCIDRKNEKLSKINVI